MRKLLVRAEEHFSDGRMICVQHYTDTGFLYYGKGNWWLNSLMAELDKKIDATFGPNSACRDEAIDPEDDNDE